MVATGRACGPGGRCDGMTPELAEHVSLLAAPIFAAMLGPHVTYSPSVSVETLTVLRKHAIEQAHALWLDALDATRVTEP